MARTVHPVVDDSLGRRLAHRDVLARPRVVTLRGRPLPRTIALRTVVVEVVTLGHVGAVPLGCSDQTLVDA